MLLVMSCPAIFVTAPVTSLQSLFYAKPATADLQEAMEFFWLLCD